MNDKTRKIVLTGFRATGKTRVGALLAARLGYTFYDLDALLTEQFGRSVAEVVARHGWPVFRTAERQLLATFSDRDQFVLATGGGAIEHEFEWRQLRSVCLVVWLDADIVTISRRMGGDGFSHAQRPSLTGQDPLAEIGEVLSRRRPLYQAGSDWHLDTTGRSPDELTDSIIAYIQQQRIRESWLEPGSAQGGKRQ